jgi:SAM-dependent methyltransferase
MSDSQRLQASVAKREGDYFDSLVGEKGDFNPFAPRGWNTLKRRFEEMIAPGRPNRPLDVLDVGCGTGRSHQIYAAQTRFYAGIDLSHHELTVARQRMSELQWVRADACELPFAAGSFDVICFSAVLHHIPDYRVALREAMRVLRDGGYAFAFDPNLLHPAMALFRCPQSPLYTQNGVSPHERPLLPKALRQAFTLTGFVELRQRCQADIPYRAVAPKLLNACLSVYNSGDWLMARLGLDRIFGILTITCGRKPLAANQPTRA